MDFDRARVLIVGDSMLDRYVSGTIDRISPEAPVPVLRRSGTRYVAGGAANVAVNAAALGATVTLITHIGDDMQGRLLAQSLAEAGVRVAAVADPDRPTTCKTRLMAGNHQVLRLDDEDCRLLDRESEDRLIGLYLERLDDCDVVILSDYGKGVLTDRLIRDVLREARARGIPTLVDPKRNDWSIYQGATYITPNRAELEQACAMPANSDDEAEAAAHVAIGRTAAAILMTRSEKGMSLFRTGSHPLHLPTRAQEVFDVSGAGDTVMAVLASALAAGYSIDGAMRYANEAAGIVVGKIGTAVVSLEELRSVVEGEGDRADRLPGALPLGDAVALRDAWRREGLTVGFTNGCFDLVHPGHIRILTRSAALCDRLIVAINSDRSVTRLKGESRPIQTEEARATVLAAIGCVNAVVIFDEDTPLRSIEALEPDVLIKGADYTVETVVGAEFVLARGGKVELIELVPSQSTSNLIAKAGMDSA